MKKTVTKIGSLILVAVLFITLLPNYMLTTFAAANIVSGAEEIEGVWEYVDGEYQDDNAGEVWMGANAYGVTSKDVGKSYMLSQSGLGDLIDTTSRTYQEAKHAIENNALYTSLQDVDVMILYLPNCPYSKNLLPKFRTIASEAGARVLLMDVSRFTSKGLLAFYNSVNNGMTSPGVLYLDANQTVAATGKKMPQGQTAVHSTSNFVELLKKAGFTNAFDPWSGEDSGYTTEQEYEREVLKETNRQRIANNLLPLATFDKLEEAAGIRAEELLTNVAHERPDGTYYSTVFEEVGLSSNAYTGENIAGGAAVTLPKRAVDAWMSSPGHRANILNSNYTHMSVGYATTDDSTKYKDNWIQLFMGKCDITKIELDQPVVQASVQGIPISDLDLNLKLTCATHGETTIPLIDEMCTGYNPNQAGEQNVTVHYGNMTTKLMINVGNVTPQELTDSMVAFKDDVSNIIYDGVAKTPAVSVFNPTGDYALIEGYSYTVSYENNINAGTATVTITGKGNYTGTVTKEFTIQPKSIEGMTIEGVADTYEYTGQPVTPTVVVKNGEQILYKDFDYTVDYKDNIGITVPGASGTPDTIDMVTPAIITVKGTGNYTGELTKNFTFVMSTLYKQATLIKNTLYNSYYSSTYEWLNTVSEKNPTAYEMILKNLNSTLVRVETALGNEGYTLNDIMSYTLYPDASKCLNDYYRHINEKSGVVLEDIVEVPEVSSSTIKSESVAIQLSGETTETSTINKDTTSVQLSVADTTTESITIDPKLYDSVSAVVLEIGLKVNDVETTDLSSPVTITMNIPDGFSPDDNLIVLHYKDGMDNPEELPAIIDPEKGTFRFVTNSFSPYVITRKVEQYDSGQTEAPSANNADITGVSFGEEDDQGPEAPANIRAYYSNNYEIAVEWDAASATNDWKVTGYKVTYSSNEDMSDAKTLTTAADTTNTVLTGMDKGTYYITVSTIADSNSTIQMERLSQTAKVEIYNDFTPAPITYIVNVVGGEVQTPKDTYNYKDKVTVTAPSSTDEGTFGYWLDSNGNTLSYASTYSFYVTSDVTLTAVYKSAPVPKQAEVSCTADYNEAKMKIVFTANRSVPAEVTSSSQVISHGIILTNKEAIGKTDFTLETAGIVKSAATTKGLLGTYVTNVSCSSGSTIYGRGYVTYRDVNGAEQTIYSQVVEYTRP